GQCIDRRGDTGGVEKGGVCCSVRLGYQIVHDLTGYRTPPALSRNIPVLRKFHAGFRGADSNSVLVGGTDGVRIFSLTRVLNILKEKPVFKGGGYAYFIASQVGRGPCSCNVDADRRARGRTAQGDPHRLGNLQPGVAGLEAERAPGAGVRQG